MKLVIAGSRGLHKPRYLHTLNLAIKQFELLNSVVVSEIVHGGNMQSADFLGWLYASEKNLPIKVFAANWEKYGRRAGPIRNREMLDYGDGLVALWDYQSPGTKHIITIMQEANKPVFIEKVVPTVDDATKFISSFPPSEVKTTIKSIK